MDWLRAWKVRRDNDFTLDNEQRIFSLSNFGPGAKKEVVLTFEGRAMIMTIPYTGGERKREKYVGLLAPLLWHLRSTAKLFSSSVRRWKINFPNCFFNRSSEEKRNEETPHRLCSHARNESLFRSIRGKDQLFFVFVPSYIGLLTFIR